MLLFGKFNILEFKRSAEQGTQRTKNVSHQIYQVLGKNFAATDLFPRACMRVIIFAAVFTNFAATLTRQPSAASLAPRLNYICNTVFDVTNLVKNHIWIWNISKSSVTRLLPAKTTTYFKLGVILLLKCLHFEKNRHFTLAL